MQSSGHIEGVYCIDTGKGTTSLVFLHYFGGSSNTWKQVIALLKDEYRCIALDLPGFGNSGELLADFTVNANAVLVINVMSSLKLQKIILIGHSMGGKIALEVASLKPKGLEKIILLAPSPPSPEPMSNKERKQLMSAYNNRSALKKNIVNIVGKPLTGVEMNSLVSDNLRSSEKGWFSWTAHGSREDITSHMPVFNIPALILSGQHDRKFSKDFLRKEFIKYFTTVSFKEIAGAGHLLPIEDADSVSKAIIRMVSG